MVNWNCFYWAWSMWFNTMDIGLSIFIVVLINHADNGILKSLEQINEINAYIFNQQMFCL